MAALTSTLFSPSASVNEDDTSAQEKVEIEKGKVAEQLCKRGDENREGRGVGNLENRRRQ